MENKSLIKSAVLTLAIVAAVVAFWEINLRNKGTQISYDDGPPLWANKRAMVYEPSDKVVVFIGSSRIKYDLDIPTWEKITNVHAVQLAMEGSSPVPALLDLANDPNFKGRLIVDVTEGLFFSNAPPNLETPNKNIKFFNEVTPAQKASFFLNKGVESQFVFLNKEYLSLNAQLDALELKSRPGVFMMPIWPMEFGYTTYDRQAYMSDIFTSDAKQKDQVKAIWHFFAEMNKKAPPKSEAELTAIFNSVKVAVDKIRARGGEVLFVRTPSSGAYLQGETMGFPRDKYWNRILDVTQCPGIHFLDYPAIAHFECPELSHLSRPQAIIFTKNFIEILEKEKGWKLTDNKIK